MTKSSSLRRPWLTVLLQHRRTVQEPKPCRPRSYLYFNIYPVDRHKMNNMVHMKSWKNEDDIESNAKETKLNNM